jgi:phage repressor protein C with HTH and peptisase S24 domain
MKLDWRERLKRAIERKQTTMKALSKGAGLGETYVRDILERDRDPSVENAKRLCATLNTSYESIFGEGPLEDQMPPMRGNIFEFGGIEYARIPVYDIRFAAGTGNVEEGDEEPIDHYLVSMNTLRAATDAPLTQLAIFQAHGDSMKETINGGDWVFVDRRKTNLRIPGIYALTVDGERLLKRGHQHLETGVVTLISDNTAYEPRRQTIKHPERLNIIGRVFLSIRRH